MLGIKAFQISVTDCCTFASVQQCCVQMQYVLAVSSAHVKPRMQLLYAGGEACVPLHPPQPPLFSLLSETGLGEQIKYVTAVTLSN